MGRNTYDIRDKSANAHFGKTQFFWDNLYQKDYQKDFRKDYRKDYPMTIQWLSNDYPMTITNFWPIFLDDHWSKNIYRPKMIV